MLSQTCFEYLLPAGTPVTTQNVNLTSKCDHFHSGLHLRSSVNVTVPCVPHPGNTSQLHTAWVHKFRSRSLCVCVFLNRYSIDRRTDMDRVFNVHAGNGSVFILRELDREENAWHNISVIATEFSKCSRTRSRRFCSPTFCFSVCQIGFLEFMLTFECGVEVKTSFFVE